MLQHSARLTDPFLVEESRESWIFDTFLLGRIHFHIRHKMISNSHLSVEANFRAALLCVKPFIAPNSFVSICSFLSYFFKGCMQIFRPKCSQTLHFLLQPDLFYAIISNHFWYRPLFLHWKGKVVHSYKRLSSLSALSIPSPEWVVVHFSEFLMLLSTVSRSPKVEVCHRFDVYGTFFNSSQQFSVFATPFNFIKFILKECSSLQMCASSSRPNSLSNRLSACNHFK